jgi:hypothetical protein
MVSFFLERLILSVLAGLLGRSLANDATAGVADRSEATGGLIAAVGLGERALGFARSFLCEAGHVYIQGSQKK